VFGDSSLKSKIMTQITLDISDNYVSFFMKLIKNFDFIKVRQKKKVSLEDELTPSQKKTWATIKEGFEEMKLVEAGIKQSRPLKELLDEL
jgi:hypothetical protein